jgi:hypothetical protein
MTEFIPGLKLSELYYNEAIRPLLDKHFPGLAHSAALVGFGSDVIGFDTPLSIDHGWGPRLVLKAVQSEEVRKLPPNIGSINQFVDSTDVADDIALCQRLKSLYFSGA